MQSNNWLGTWNNPPTPDQGESVLASLHQQSKAKYTVGQLEKGEQGTVHLQFFMNFKDQKKLGGLKKLAKEIHWEKVKINNGADNYCMKEETRLDGPWTFGVKPVKRNDQTDWEEVKMKAQQGRLDEIPADIYVKHYSNLTKIKKDHLKITDSDHLRGIWIYGEAGVGKSRLAREKYPDAYPKLCNKWWDGYQGQKYVIMDDLMPEHKCLGQQLKIWADRYGCILETKGGAITSEYDWFIVTSQYKIEEIFGDDEKTVAALKRRFKCVHVKSYDCANSRWTD